jgi:hypothetical protein
MVRPRPALGAVPVRFLALAGVVALLVAGFQLVARPRFLAWGATEDERQFSLPGDEILPGAASQNTRAITIAAPPDRVWPWLAQIGQTRGGFYSYDLLENLAGCRMPTEDVLRADQRAWRPGDQLWMYPAGKAGGAGFATLRVYEPGRALGFATRAVGTGLDEPEDRSWSFVLRAAEERSTRLLIRGRAADDRSWAGRVFDRLVFEPAHYAMERRMMLGLARVARGLDRERWRNHVEVGLWTAVFGAFVFAGVLTLLRDDWPQVLAAFAAAGIVFQVLTLAQPPLLFGAVLSITPFVLLTRVPERVGPRRVSQDRAGPCRTSSDLV